MPTRHLTLMLALLFPIQASAEQTKLRYFGYAAISCGHDDPFDTDPKTDYTDEVAGFTNANQLCVTGDMDLLAQRLRHGAANYTPIFYLEPVFFIETPDGLRANPDAPALWKLVRGAIAASGVPPGNLIFYLADEPTLRGLPPASIPPAVAMVRGAYPGARTMLIEAYHGPAAPHIPPGIDIWGFDAYTIPDPLSEPRYTAYLDLAGRALSPGQSLAIIMDATHTPSHAQAGISPSDLADIAWRYLALAQSRDDVSMILAYSWAGGIDHARERGVRDLPTAVQTAHRAIGAQVLNRR